MRCHKLERIIRVTLYLGPHMNRPLAGHILICESPHHAHIARVFPNYIGAGFTMGESMFGGHGFSSSTIGTAAQTERAIRTKDEVKAARYSPSEIAGTCQRDVSWIRGVFIEKENKLVGCGSQELFATFPENRLIQVIHAICVMVR